MRKKSNNHIKMTMIKNTIFAIIPFESKKLLFVVLTSVGLEKEFIVSFIVVLIEDPVFDMASPVFSIVVDRGDCDAI
jgi:hypothetical protein